MGISLASLSPWAQEQASKKIREQIRGEQIPIAPKRSKYGNTPTVYKSTQGFERRYDSKLEARYAATLDLGVEHKLVNFWLPQVAFPLIGGVVYRCDFLVSWADGRLTVVDTKGRDTPDSINKRKQVKAQYGVEVEIVRNA